MVPAPRKPNSKPVVIQLIIEEPLKIQYPVLKSQTGETHLLNVPKLFLQVPENAESIQDVINALVNKYIVSATVSFFLNDLFLPPDMDIGILKAIPGQIKVRSSEEAIKLFNTVDQRATSLLFSPRASAVQQKQCKASEFDDSVSTLSDYSSSSSGKNSTSKDREVVIQPFDSGMSDAETLEEDQSDQESEVNKIAVTPSHFCQAVGSGAAILPEDQKKDETVMPQEVKDAQLPNASEKNENKDLETGEKLLDLAEVLTRCYDLQIPLVGMQEIENAEHIHTVADNDSTTVQSQQNMDTDAVGNTLHEAQQNEDTDDDKRAHEIPNLKNGEPRPISKRNGSSLLVEENMPQARDLKFEDEAGELNFGSKSVEQLRSKEFLRLNSAPQQSTSKGGTDTNPKGGIKKSKSTKNLTVRHSARIANYKRVEVKKETQLSTNLEVVKWSKNQEKESQIDSIEDENHSET